MTSNNYLHQYRDQTQVTGVDGQERLAHPTLHAAGLGGLANTIVFQSGMAGFRRFTANDPQRLEWNNLNRWTGMPHIGAWKVDAFAAMIEIRFPEMRFQGLAVPNESPKATPLFRQAAVIISASNTEVGRRTAIRQAIESGAVLIDAAVADATQAAAGAIIVRRPEPEFSWQACPGCFYTSREVFNRAPDEQLLFTVISAVASLATHLLVGLAAGTCRDLTSSFNYFRLSLDDFVVEKLAVERRPDCEICGTPITRSDQ